MHMAGFLPSESSPHGLNDGGSYEHGQDRLEKGPCWYFSRKEIEENSPSRQDGIDLKTEICLRNSYATFLQDLGTRLNLPQCTTATALVFCHRFFLRQSHAKNDRLTIATVCMLLAGMVEETPRPLKDVILVSYEIIHKDPKSVQRVKQKEVYERQKEIILHGERVVLETLCYDLNVLHPYKPLIEAIKKIKVAQRELALVTWNVVSDGLRTSLCLQFKPHHIAAGAIFVAAKFLRVNLPSDDENVWWLEFDITPSQLEEISNQMLELYELDQFPASNEVEGSAENGYAHLVPANATAFNEEQVSYLLAGGARPGTLKTVSPVPDQPDQNVDVEFKENQQPGPFPSHQEHIGEAQNVSKFRSEGCGEEGQEDKAKFDTREVGELKDRQFGRGLENVQGALGQSPQDVIRGSTGETKEVLGLYDRNSELEYYV